MATKTASQRKILNISLPRKLYFEVEKSAKKGTKTKAELGREAIRRYLQDEREWEEIRKWGEQAAKKFGVKNEDDVERIVDEVRSGKE